MKNAMKILGLMLMVSNSYAGQCDFAINKESMSSEHHEMLLNRLTEQGYRETSPEQANILIESFKTACWNAEYIRETRYCTESKALISYLFQNEYAGRVGLKNSDYGYESNVPYWTKRPKNEIVESRVFIGSDWSALGSASDDKAITRALKKIPKCVER